MSNGKNPTLIDTLIEGAKSKVYQPDIKPSPPSGMEGSTGFEPLNKYDTGLLRGMNQPEQRAITQPNSRAILNSIVQIGSTVIGDAVSGVGYLGELGDINDIVSGKETEWGNWLVELGEGIKQKGEEIAPVYASQEAMTTFAPWDWEWWASNIPSIGSTLALAVPAVGTVGLVSRFGKALNIAQKIGSTTGKFARGISSAIISRHIENMMESKEVFDNSYQLALSKGRSEEEAKAVAGRAASDSYNANYVNLITDVPQYLQLLGVRLPGVPKAKNKLLRAGQVLGGGFVSEAAEEATQFIIQQEAERGAKLELGEKDDSTFGQRFTKYLGEPGLQTAAFFGGIGGTLFAGVAKAFEKMADRANMPPEQARQEALKDVVADAAEKGDFETAKKTVNELKADPAIADNTKAQENLAKAEDTLNHAQNVHDNLTNDPYQKEKTKLAAEAKMLEQNLQQNQQNYVAIAANIENKDGLDYQFLKLQKEALKGDRSPEAKVVRDQLDAELNSDRFAEVVTTRTQYSPYTTQLKTLAAEKVRDMKAQESLTNEIEKYETPEGQEQLAKEKEKETQKQQEAIVKKAQEATTPEQITSLKQANPELADKLDEVKQNKAAEQSKEAPGNWKDYTPENIDEFMKARYGDRPFLLEQDMARAKVSTPEELRDYYVDKLTPAEQPTPQEPTSPEPPTQEDFGLQPAEEIPTPQPTEQVAEVPPVESTEERLLDQLESEATAKNAPEKVQESQEIEGYYDRTPEVDDTVDGYFESDKIENPYLSITNDMALYQVVDHPEKGKLVEFSGIGKQGQVMPLEQAKSKYRINETATDWTTLYDTSGNTVPSQWRQPDIPQDDLRTAFQGGLGPGSKVEYIVDTRSEQDFSSGGWEKLRILMRVVNQAGDIVIGMVKAYYPGKVYMEGTEQNFQAFRQAVFNEYQQWKQEPGRKDNDVFVFSKTGTLSEIYAGRYWNTPVRNNPKAILASDEPFVLGVGVTEGEGGAVQYVDNNPGIDVQRSLKEPRPGGVYQAVRSANGKFAWSRIFTKKLSDETARAKKGMFPTWEKFYGGFQDVSLDQVVMDLLSIAEQGKTDEAAAKFWKDNWPNIRRELQSMVRFNVVSKDGKTKRHAPDFRDNLPEIFRKNNFTAQSYYNKYDLGNRPIQVNAQLVNKEFGELGEYNDLIADRLETDINGPGPHTHSPKFSVTFPDMGEAKAEQPIVQPKSLIADPDEDFRFSVEESGEQYEIWDESEGRAYFAKKYPNIPVRVYEQIYTSMGQKAHGAFHKAAGFLMSKTAKKGTRFHEEFHAVFNLGLPEPIRAKVLEDVKKHYGITDNVQAEEYLADAFQEYMQTLDTSLTARIKRAFKRLLELIRFSLTNKMSIDYLFDRIEQGKYSNIQLGPRFETRYKLVKGFKNLAEQRQRLKEMMYLFDGVVSQVMQSRNIEDVKEAYSLVVNNMDNVLRGKDTWEGIPTVLATLQAQKKLDMSQSQREKIDRFIKAVETKAIDKAFEQKLGSRGIYKREATANAEDTELFDIGEEDFIESWQTSQFKISPLENLSGKLKRFLDNVPRYRMVKNAKGKYPVILSDIGIPQTHDGKFLYADLQTRLGTSVSVADMVSKLDDLAEHMPHYDFVRRAVAAKPELATHLFAMAQKANPEFFDIVNYKGTYSIKYSNTDSLPNSLLSEWYTGFSSHYENKYLNAQGEVVYKKELERKWQDLSNRASSQDVTSELHQFFLRLGINIPLDVLQASYADNNLGGIASKFNAILAPFVNSGKVEISKENKSTRAFAQEVSKYYPVTYQSAHINVEGNRQYEWINSSYMAKLVAKLKIPHLRDGVEQMLRKDMFYNELLDSGVLSLKRWSNARWGVVGGIKRSERGRGTGFTNYSDKDTAITLLSMFKEGWHPVSVNSSSSPVLATVKIADSYNKELSPDQALDKLFALANAEYARIQNRTNPGWKAYTPGKYAFFPELNPKSGTPGAPSKAKIAEIMEQQLQELRSKLVDLKVLEKGKLSFDKSLDTDTFLRQFIYNFNLRQAEIIMMMQGDPSFYKNTEDFFKRAREVWSPGNYLDTKAEFKASDGRLIKFHRDKYNMKVLADVEGKAPQYDEIKANLIESLKKTYGNTRTEGEIEGEVEVIMKEYEEVNETDAQSYIDLYSYRLRLLGEGRWTQKLQDAYDILVPGKNDRTVFQPIKPFYYSLQAYKDLVYPMQNKDAEFLLVPGFANGNPQLEEMLFDMGYSKGESTELSRDEIYTKLGYDKFIVPSDTIVFGHPLIGKSFLKQKGGDDFLSLDDDVKYLSKIEEGRKKIFAKYPDQNLDKYIIQDSAGTAPWHKDYKNLMQEVYEEAKDDALSQGKTLFLSNTELLKNNLDDFDKIINIPDDVFINRVKKTRPNAKYDIKEWKQGINKVLAKANQKKVITTSGYLSDLFLTDEQEIEVNKLYWSSNSTESWSFDEAGRDQGKYTDKISFESAIKVAVKEPFRGDTLETATPIEMHWESWRRQMETPEHYIDAATRFGTQVMKLITADLADDADFGNDRTGKDIKKEYENLVIQDIIRSSEELMSRFAEVDDKGQLVSVDKEKFVQILREEVNQRQLGEQYIDALEMTYNEVLDEMDTSLPLFHPLHSTRVESMISSLFKNNITKQKFANGVQLYNVSAYGLERKPGIKFRDDGSIDHIECYAPAYSKAFDKYRREDGTLHVEDVPKEMLEGLVYRIPTEDKYSMFNIRIIGFTNDSSGGAIILPSEITKIAGLDFDIDKTYGFFYGEPPAYNDFNVARQSVEGRKMLRANREKLDALYTSKKETLSKLDALFASKENSSNRRDALAHLYKEIDLELAFLRNDLRNAIKELQDEAYSLATTKMWLEEQGAPDLSNADVFLASQQESIGNQIEALNYYIEELENKKKRIEGLQIDLSSTITSKDQDVNQVFIENKKINDQIDVAKGEKALLIKNLNTPENQKLLQNKIDKIKSDNAKLKLMKEVLSHPSMTKAFLQPGGFHTIREITKRIREWKRDTSQTASITNPNVIIDTIRRVNSGAALTGIAANYNASKARWQNYPMTLSKGYFLFEGQIYNDLSAVDVVNKEDKDATPRKVSKNIAEVLAAAVDNGKEPLAEYWNLNTYTADVAMSMLTTGVPLKTVMWFMSQPSIVKHTQEYFNLGGKEPQLELTIPDSPENITGKELRQGLQKPGEEQTKMLQNFLYYKNLVKPVTELVAATKVPDAGAGPSIAHTVSRQRQYYTRLEDRIEGSKAFLQSNSFHSEFVQKGISQALDVFTMLGFPNFTFNSGLKKVLDLISGGVKTSDLTAEETNKIYQHYMEYLASAHPFFSSTGARNLHENLHHKVTAAKSKSDNLFLNRLEVTDKVINFRAVVSIHKEELNDYREAWAEMLKDQTEIEPGYTMSQLATDLVRYSFLRSGFNPQGFGNFAHLQPIEFYTETKEGREFNNLIIKQVQAQNQVSDTKPYEGFVEQFVRNNFQRLYYVPEVKEEEVVFKDGKPVGLVEPKGRFDPKYKKFGNMLFKAIQGIYAPIPALGIYEGEIQAMREYQFGDIQPDSEFNEDSPKNTPPASKTETPENTSEPVPKAPTQYEQTVPEDHGKVAEVNALEGKMPEEQLADTGQVDQAQNVNDITFQINKELQEFNEQRTKTKSKIDQDFRGFAATEYKLKNRIRDLTGRLESYELSNEDRAIVDQELKETENKLQELQLSIDRYIEKLKPSDTILQTGKPVNFQAYHGSFKPFEGELKIESSSLEIGDLGDPEYKKGVVHAVPAVFATSNEYSAEGYTLTEEAQFKRGPLGTNEQIKVGQVYKVNVRSKNPLVVDFDGEIMKSVYGVDYVLDYAKRKKHDLVMILKFGDDKFGDLGAGFSNTYIAIENDVITKTRSGNIDQAQTLWLNYQDKIKAKNPKATFEGLKKAIQMKGLDEVTRKLKECYG